MLVGFHRDRTQPGEPPFSKLIFIAAPTASNTFITNLSPREG